MICKAAYLSHLLECAGKAKRDTALNWIVMGLMLELWLGLRAVAALPVL